MKKIFLMLICFFSLFVVAVTSSCSDPTSNVETSFHVVKQPTCTEAGLEERTLSDGTKETRSIPALGHNYVNGYCTECGEKE